MKTSYGYCQCGCGQPAPVAQRNHSRHGFVKGEPIRFISGHNGKLQVGKFSNNWKGGEIKKPDGRIMVHRPSHPRANGNNGYVFKSILITENVLGKFLPEKVIVHHSDGNPKNETKSNYTICENQGYHQLLHQRKRAYEACGNPNWRKCRICKTYDDPKNLKFDKNGQNQYHVECNKIACRNRYNKYYKKG